MALHRVARRASIATALLFALASCASLPPAGDLTRCGSPGFPYSEGWLGGDAAYSIPLAPDRILWLFGDTFVAPSATGAAVTTRRGARLVHNSVAISMCQRSGEWSFDYAWGRAEDGSPEAFLAPVVPDTYWWLFDGFVHREKLYIGLLEVRPSEPRGALGLPFRFTGVKLARIENFRAPPERWSVEVLPLSQNEKAFPISSLVVDADHLYLFAFLQLEIDRYPRALARLPVSALEAGAPAEQLEYLSRSGAWKPGLDPTDALLLMADDASEMSVRHHPEIDRWIAIYNYPSLDPDLPIASPSELIYLRTAENLEGPWSEARAIFRIPEMAAAAGRDPNVFCYAAKEHPQLAREGELLITYVCNLFARSGEDPYEVLRRLQDEMSLYRPRAVSLPLPEIH